MNTIINFYIIDFKKDYNYYNYICLNDIKKKIEINNQIITVEIEEKDIPIFSAFYFIENIKLMSIDKDSNIKRETIYFNIPIYIKEQNNIITFINEISNYSFELIFNMQSKENLPSFLDINNYKIGQNDRFGLPNCIRYCLLNCKKEYIKNIGYKIHLNQQYINGTFLISIKEIKKNIYNTKIFKTRREYYNFYSIKKIEDFSKSNIHSILSILDKENAKAISSKININSYKIIKDYIKLSESEIVDLNNYFDTMKKLINNKLRNIQFEEYNENHYDFCFSYCLWKFFSKVGSIFMISEFEYFHSMVKNLGNLNWKEKINTLFFFLEIKLFENSQQVESFHLSKNNYENEYGKDNKLKSDNIPIFTQKIDNTLDFNNYIESIKKKEKNIDKYKLKRNFINNFYYTNVPSILFFSDINKNSAYYQSYNLLKKIIENINSDSYIFDLLYMINSGTGNNKLTNEITFKHSLLSEEKIKKELNSLIPKYIFRESIAGDYNAYYSPYSKLISVNENSYFNFSIENGEEMLIERDDVECKYTIPLLVLFMHEYLGHGKHAFKNNLKFGREHSPTHITINYKDNPLTFYTENKGESGRLIEFFISPYEEIIYYIKYSQDNFKELMDFNLWISNTMDELNYIVAKKIIATNFDLEKEKKKKKGTLLNNFPIPSQNKKEVSDSDEEDYEELIFLAEKSDNIINKFNVRGACYD